MRKVTEEIAKSEEYFSANAKLLMQTAKEEGIPVLEIDPRYDLFQLGYGKYSTLFRGLITESSSAIFAQLNQLAIRDGLLAKLGLKTASKNKKGGNKYRLLVVEHKVRAIIEEVKRKQNLLVQLNPATKEILEEITRIYNLKLVEFSLLSSDITSALDKTGWINSLEMNPTLSDYQEVLNLTSLSRQLINYHTSASIPIITVLASNNRLVIRLISGLLAKVALKMGIVVNNKGNKLNRLLQNNEVEIILHGLSTNTLKKKDLPYQESELLISAASVLNLAEIELTSKKKALNIDKENDLKQDQAENIYCSLNKNNLALQRHIKANQPAVFTTKDNLVLFDGEERLPIIALDRLRINRADNSELIAAILYTAAAAYVLEIPIFLLRSFLVELTSPALLMNSKENIR